MLGLDAAGKTSMYWPTFLFILALTNIYSSLAILYKLKLNQGYA